MGLIDIVAWPSISLAHPGFHFCNASISLLRSIITLQFRPYPRLPFQQHAMWTGVSQVDARGKMTRTVDTIRELPRCEWSACCFHFDKLRSDYGPVGSRERTPDPVHAMAILRKMENCCGERGLPHPHSLFACLKKGHPMEKMDEHLVTSPLRDTKPGSTLSSFPAPGDGKLCNPDLEGCRGSKGLSKEIAAQCFAFHLGDIFRSGWAVGERDHSIR